MTLNCCLIIAAAAKQGWSLSSYSSNNIFFLSLISTKIMSKKILILFNWSFLSQIWNKRFKHSYLLLTISLCGDETHFPLVANTGMPLKAHTISCPQKVAAMDLKSDRTLVYLCCQMLENHQKQICTKMPYVCVYNHQILGFSLATEDAYKYDKLH